MRSPLFVADGELMGPLHGAIAADEPADGLNSVTAGVVSGLNRKFTSSDNTVVINDLIQTDASINPGSSGGGLFNLDGELVGINLAVAQNAQGIGFAIPYIKIKDIMRQYYELMKNQPASVKIPVK